MNLSKEQREALKGCPFCGGTNIQQGYDYKFVMCNTCGASCYETDTQPESNCVAAWNRRAAPSADDAPTGWKLVPVEPTEKMALAADNDPLASCETGLDEYRAIYSAMLAAAPTPEDAPSADDAGKLTIRIEKDRFDRMMDALDRAERKGYLPDAMAEEWAAFEWEVVPRQRTPEDAPSTAQGVALTDEQIEGAALRYCAHVVGDGYDTLRFDCAEDRNNFVREFAAAKPASVDAQPASGVDDARDAARYRYLQEQRSHVWHEFADTPVNRTNEIIDAEIAQRAQENYD